MRTADNDLNEIDVLASNCSFGHSICANVVDFIIGWPSEGKSRDEPLFCAKQAKTVCIGGRD